jgi:signal transduction histidine kinase/ActR/RegA family two-component response regulator
MPNWNASALHRVAIALGVVVVGIFLAMTGLVAYSAAAVDDLHEQEELRLVVRALDRALVQLGEDVASAAIWNDAYDAVRRNDREWMQVNFGDYYADFMDHTLTVVVDSAGAPVFASRDSEGVATDSETSFLMAVSPMVTRLREDSLTRAADAAESVEGFDLVSTQQSLMRLGDDIYLVAGSTVVPELWRPDLAEPFGVVVSAQPIARFLAMLDRDLAIQSPRLALAGAPSATGFDLVSASRAPLGRLNWTPLHPGGAVLAQALPLIVFIGMVLIAASALLLVRVLRILDALARKREDLRASLVELRAARDAAEQASTAKSQFLASMSHEIRTPLNGILGMAQSLSDSPTLTPEDAEKVRIVLSSGDTLTKLLNDVLDLSKIEAGKLEIQPIDVDLPALLRQSTALFSAVAEDKGLIFSVSAPAACPHMRIDPLRFQQCVSNLVSNAIKFTATGRVEIEMAAHPLAGGDYQVIVWVRDSGVGMDEETINRLFENFVQADASTTRTFGGSGLGLAIARRLARMMGGDIKVSSQMGYGSTFELHIRAQRGNALAAIRPEAAPADRRNDPRTGRRVLIVDDNATNRQVAKLFLAPLGLHMAEAQNGREALDCLARERFDLVLLDVHMPVMDGRQCIAQIRGSEQSWRNIPVIALTAEAMSGDRERLLALGMSDYASKPIDRAALMAKVAYYLDSAAQLAVSGPTAVVQTDNGDVIGKLPGDLDDMIGENTRQWAS